MLSNAVKQVKDLKVSKSYIVRYSERNDREREEGIQKVRQREVERVREIKILPSQNEERHLLKDSRYRPLSGVGRIEREGEREREREGEREGKREREGGRERGEREGEREREREREREGKEKGWKEERERD